MVAQVLRKLLQEAKQNGLDSRIIYREPGDENGTVKTAVIELKGNKLDGFLKQWIGTVQWIGQSTFRKSHKRKNWFIGVNEIAGNGEEEALRDADIRYAFTRLGGPGGQHVNKVSTAVRATHTPTGLTAFSSSGRSQLQNKTDAKAKLIKKLEEKAIKTQVENAKDAWSNHSALERGSPIRVFKGSDFKSNHVVKTYKATRKKLKDDWKSDDLEL